MANVRREQLVRFYALLDELEKRIGGARSLIECSGRLEWPRRGVYFFRESSEMRSDTGKGPRIVRVGTHALKEGSETTLWNRLSQHKGRERTSGGNHRGSIFRLIVGTAMIARDRRNVPTWGRGNTASADVMRAENPFERDVSAVVRRMPFLWLKIDDEPGPSSLRGYTERNAIALLSNYGRTPLDPPSASWLGRHCDRERVRNSGLWNSTHVDDACDSGFLGTFEELVGSVENYA